jgi:hypothetical protein
MAVSARPEVVMRVTVSSQTLEHMDTLEPFLLLPIKRASMTGTVVNQVAARLSIPLALYVESPAIRRENIGVPAHSTRS